MYCKRGWALYFVGLTPLPLASFLCPLPSNPSYLVHHPSWSVSLVWEWKRTRRNPSIQVSDTQRSATRSHPNKLCSSNKLMMQSWLSSKRCWWEKEVSVASDKIHSLIQVSYLNKKNCWPPADCPKRSQKASKDSHFTSLFQLHLLPIQYRVHFKILVLTCKALNYIAPVYSRELLPHILSNSLRSCYHHCSLCC